MILVLGANGRTGRHLVRHLCLQKQPVTAFLRAASQAAQFEEMGAQVYIGNLDSGYEDALTNVDTVIYAAGSAEDQGAAEERAYDRDAIIRLGDMAAAKGVARIVIISALMALDKESPAGPLQHYRQMKYEGDEYIRNLGVPYLIVAPTTLTDDPATGTVALQPLPRSGVPSISREDVALFTVEALKQGLEHRSIGISGGEQSIAEAVRTLTS